MWLFRVRVLRRKCHTYTGTLPIFWQTVYKFVQTFYKDCEPFRRISNTYTRAQSFSTTQISSSSSAHLIIIKSEPNTQTALMMVGTGQNLLETPKAILFSFNGSGGGRQNVLESVQLAANWRRAHGARQINAPRNLKASASVFEPIHSTHAPKTDDRTQINNKHQNESGNVARYTRYTPINKVRAPFNGFKVNELGECAVLLPWPPLVVSVRAECVQRRNVRARGFFVPHFFILIMSKVIR